MIGTPLVAIAEGVETDGQRAFLDKCGCSNYQGYLFGRPVPVTEFESALNACGARHPAAGGSNVGLPAKRGLRPTPHASTLAAPP